MASEDQDISVKVLESFWTQKHFDTYESRSDFRELYMKEMPSSPQLLNCISVMKNIYKKLLAKCCVGKKFLQLQQSWLLHLHFYIEGSNTGYVSGLVADDKMECHDVWKAIIDKAAVTKDRLSVPDQRVIIGSLAYAIFDAMAGEIKQKKMESRSESPGEYMYQEFETTDTLRRYCGAALHSMIEKCEKISKHHRDLKYLKSIKFIHQQYNSENRGLTYPAPQLIPFLHALMLRINELINHKESKKHGKDMIKVAMHVFLTKHINELEVIFSDCLEDIDCSIDLREFPQSLIIEMIKKIFNSRVNEFMEAQKELDLEKKGKVTNAQQSLRDTLKTYSNNKTRD